MSDPYLESFEQFLERSIARPGLSRHAQVAGRRLHYLEWPGPPGAPPLLLLHGFLAHAHWWDFVAPSLAESYRVIAPDFSGMGDSEYRDDYSHAHLRRRKSPASSRHWASPAARRSATASADAYCSMPACGNRS